MAILMFELNSFLRASIELFEFSASIVSKNLIKQKLWLFFFEQKLSLSIRPIFENTEKIKFFVTEFRNPPTQISRTWLN